MSDSTRHCNDVDYLSFYTLLNEITCKKHILVSVSSVSVSAWGLSLKCNQKGGGGGQGGRGGFEQ